MINAKNIDIETNVYSSKDYDKFMKKLNECDCHVTECICPDAVGMEFIADYSEPEEKYMAFIVEDYDLGTDCLSGLGVFMYTKYDNALSIKNKVENLYKNKGYNISI